MGMSLQIRENLSELLFSELYDTDDTELLVERSKAFKERPKPCGEPRENPVFKRIMRSMGVRLDHSALRDYYYSSPPGKGNVLIFPYKDTEFFAVLDLHRDRLEETDAVVLAVYCDSRKYVILKELFLLLQKYSRMEVKLPVTEAPLIKAVLEAGNNEILYNGDRLHEASKEDYDLLILPKEPKKPLTEQEEQNDKTE